METVIAIPLYLVMLGGIIWIGDLMLTRQKLVIADRYATWNYGSRHEPGEHDAGAIHQRFFDSSEYRRPTAVQKERQDFDWMLRARGQVKLTFRMPEWTLYMFNAAAVMYGAQLPAETWDLIGRSLGGKHAVLMRTKAEAQPSYIRNKYGIPESGEVARQWEEIADEAWPY